MLKKRIKTDIIAILVILAVAVGLIAIGYRAGEVKTRQTEWENNRRVVSYIVDSGDTLWNISKQYKPEWLDIREYMFEVRQLNNISSDLQVGDTLLLYAYGNSERYTLDGVYAKDGTIITEDGNEWSYCLGDIYMLGDTTPCTVVLDDNNTPHIIDDDTIIDVTVTRG